MYATGGEKFIIARVTYKIFLEILFTELRFVRDLFFEVIVVGLMSAVMFDYVTVHFGHTLMRVLRGSIFAISSGIKMRYCTWCIKDLI